MAAFALAGAGDEANVVGTLVSAFIDDPWERWAWPQPQEYFAHFPTFVAAFGGPAFAQQTVWMLPDFAAVAMWIPPGAEPDADAIVAALTQTISREKHDDIFSVLEQMDAVHPTYEHWYLPWLGVDRGRTSGGLGSELLAQCLAVVDADRLPAFLETPNPRTIPFYERHGFEVVNVAEVGASPPVTSMLRPSR